VVFLLMLMENAHFHLSKGAVNMMIMENVKNAKIKVKNMK
jgi:hypothetical protein